MNIIKKYAMAYSAMEKMNVQFISGHSGSQKIGGGKQDGADEENSKNIKNKNFSHFARKPSKKGGFNAARLALSALFAALSVVILLSGQLFSVFDLTALAGASIISAIVALELGSQWAWLCWGVVSAISLIILPEKIIAVGYALLAGIYPVIKFYLERLRPVMKIMLKYLFFNVMFLLVLFISSMFLPAEDFIIRFIPLVIIGGNALFFIYDLALTSCAAFYIVKLRARLKIWRYI